MGSRGITPLVTY